MWIANLSNGQTATEGEAQPGERLPWQQLLDFCITNQIRITGLRLQVNGRMAAALPPKACDGYFFAHEVHMRGSNMEQQFHMQGIGSVIEDRVYIIWIDDQGNVYTDVRELESCLIHTTLRS